MGRNEIAIEIHCDAGGILTKTGSISQIGICGFSGKQIAEGTKNVEFQLGIADSWAGSGSPRVSTSIYAGKYKRCFIVSTWSGC